MQSVFIAGATGYLGRYLCAEYERRGCYVTALVRDKSRARDINASALIEAEATRPDTLADTMEGADLVVSALGITRQKDGLTYRDVDFQANLNLLREAERAGVSRFAYVHVLNAHKMRHVPLVAAKADFVDALQRSPIASTVIAPSGYFSDMQDFLKMAQASRVWLFGTGTNRINPIHGADLATAIAEATDTGTPWLNVGGPDTFTHQELAELAFDCIEKTPRITYLPDGIRRAALQILPWVTPQSLNGPVQFFLTAMAMDMVGQSVGTRHLADHFKASTKTR